MSAYESSRSTAVETADMLSGGGEMGALIRAKDWGRTPVGPVQQWPQSLRTALGILLDSGYAMYIAWGPEFTQFYNDAYRPILGQTKHPAALGESTRVTFAEIWDFIGPMFKRVLDEGLNTTLVDQLLPLNRNGFLEECYFTFSYSAIRAEAGTVGGVFVTVIETTERVIGERRLQTLRELAAQASDTRNTALGIARAAQILAKNVQDVPAALVYILDATRKVAVLQDGFGFSGVALPNVQRIAMDDAVAAAPFKAVIQSGMAALVDNAATVFGEVSGCVWPEEVRSALTLPLSRSGQSVVAGFLVVGVSPRLQLEGSYDSFFHLAANYISSALSNAHSYEEERQRAEALAELDRAKTTFFSNVSHEFRTPLTLMLGPLEDTLNSAESLSPEARDRVALAHRNSLRLLKLVNTLLDFSRIEAGKVNAHFEAIDLADWTRDICSVFRSAIEKAGLKYEIDFEALHEFVSVDRGMWEKIVLNLLSNAFKFTFEGGILIRLRRDGSFAVLEVQDTGTGIPAAELPHIFERFYRVEAARGRTFEGTGIGLALVSELVRLHGGTIEAESEFTKGTTFRVRVPFEQEDLPPVNARSGADGTSAAARAGFAEEAERWLPEGDKTREIETVSPAGEARQRIVVADDNADMRAYVSRLLSADFDVIAVSNGEEALTAVREHKPALLLSDVMMPRLDGIGLIRNIRADAQIASVPVILLSARVGEEARLDGLAAGADDYLQKPFGAKELLARVKSHVGMRRVREGVSQLERSLRASAEEDRQRWRDLLLRAPAMIAILRGPQHVFELANPAYLAAVARTEEQVVGKPVAEALPELTEQKFPELLDDVYRTGQPFVANEVRAMLDVHGTGFLAPRYFNLAYVPSFGSTGSVEGILVHATDVTEQVQAREAAQESERQLRKLAEAIPQLVWSCLPDGLCDFLSAQWVEYTGIPEADQLGLKWLDAVIHPADRERVIASWIAAVEDLAAYDLEYRIRRFDGVYRWFKTRGTPVRDGSGNIVKWFGTCTDIEDQLNAAQEREALLKREQAARATAELLNRVGPALAGELDPRKLVQQVTDLATELAGAEFGALFHNVRDESGESFLLYTLSGVPKEAFEGFPMPRNTEMFGPIFRGESVVLCDDVTNDPRYGRNTPYSGMPAGHPPVRSFLAVPVVSRSGGVLGGLFFGHALPAQFTQQHATLVSGIAAQAAIALDNANLFAEAQRAQTEIEATNTELRQANKDLEQFAYAAAHDLQEPLRMVTTYSELIARRLGPNADDKIGTYVKFLTGASGRMILLLQDLLAYTETTLQSDAPSQRVNLNVVLEKSLSNVATAVAESEAVVEADLLPVVLGRESAFMQLFQNLIANAIKYRKAEERPVIRITSEARDELVCICVRDNGIGIAPEYHKQIFGVFRRLHGSEIPGTGIGLAICQRVVERAGGRLWVESEAGQGAAFYIELPVAS